MPYTCDDIHELESLLNSKQDQLAIYQLELEDLQADLADLQEDLTVARNLLSQFENNLANQKTLLNEKIVEKQQVELQIIQIRQYIAFLELKLLNLQNEKADLLAYVQGQPEIITAWCADYTLDLTGEVGLADVPGASGLDFQGTTYYSPAVTRQIRPGYEGRANYNSARDGILQHAKASAPANHFLQAIRHSAAMKWKPQYRHGIITAINYENNTCSVSLNPAYDKYMFNGYNVNRTSELTGIAIEYMECNSLIFEVGDDVIIEWAGRVPKVIGFKDFPKPCNFHDYIYIECNAVPTVYYDVNLETIVTAGGYVNGCIIWDSETNDFAVVPLDDESGNAVFPCDPALISNWLSTGRHEINEFLSHSNYGKAFTTDLESTADNLIEQYPSAEQPSYAPAGCNYGLYELTVGEITYKNNAFNNNIVTVICPYWDSPQNFGGFGFKQETWLYPDYINNPGIPATKRISSSRGDAQSIIRIERGYVNTFENWECFYVENEDAYAVRFISETPEYYKVVSPFRTMFETDKPNNISGCDDSRQYVHGGYTEQSVFCFLWTHLEPGEYGFEPDPLPESGVFCDAVFAFSKDETGRGNIATAVPNIWSLARNSALSAAIVSLYWFVAENENTGWKYDYINTDIHTTFYLPSYTFTAKTVRMPVI